jgi:hypothetical protein
MSMGRRRDPQPSMWVTYNEICEAPGHRFYEKLNELLREAEFDRKAEELCAPYYQSSNTPGRRSIPPGVYFRMHLVGFFEGIESERGLEWRFANSLSLRQFLGPSGNSVGWKGPGRGPSGNSVGGRGQVEPTEVKEDGRAEALLVAVAARGLP